MAAMQATDTMAAAAWLECLAVAALTQSHAREATEATRAMDTTAAAAWRVCLAAAQPIQSRATVVVVVADRRYRVEVARSAAKWAVQ